MVDAGGLDLPATMGGLPPAVTVALSSIVETLREGLLAFTASAGLWQRGR